MTFAIPLPLVLERSPAADTLDGGGLDQVSEVWLIDVLVVVCGTQT